MRSKEKTKLQVSKLPVQCFPIIIKEDYSCCFIFLMIHEFNILSTIYRF